MSDLACLDMLHPTTVHSLQAMLMSEMAEAWIATVSNRLGLFDCSFDAKAYKETPAGDAIEDRPSDQLQQPQHSIVEATAAHHIWLAFLLQAWQVSSP